MKKNIIITGTSRGIGFALVEELINAGHSVLALSRNIRPTEELKNTNCHSLSFDISQESAFESVEKFIQERWNGKVDILVNNAGILINKPFAELSTEDFSKVYSVNVFGVARLTQLVLPYMSAGGSVLNISSMGGVQGSVKFAGLAAYSSSKGALITLTELLAEEYKETGITFNAFALGAVQTEMLQEAFPEYHTKTSPQDIAKFITFFLFYEAKLFNGKTIQVANSTP